MTDHAKAVKEIEDVLVSIRRLVSESNAPSVLRPAEPARLVLTEAHRVTEPDDPWAPVPTPGGEAETPDTEAEDPTWGLEDRLSDWGEIEGSAQEAVEDAIAEQSDPSPPSPTRTPQAELPPLEEPEEAEFFDFESETGDSDWPDQGASRVAETLALVRGHAGQADAARPDEAADRAPDAAQDTPEATGSDETDMAADTELAGVAEFEDAEQGTTTLIEEPVAVAEPEPATESDREQDTAMDDQAPAPAEEMTRVFSRRVEVRRPPTEETEHAATEAGMQSISAPDEDEIEDLGDEPQPFVFPETEDGVLDEETLREIIAEVVREELQGALGQRITRNVRKMVRREIRLALAAQDLE